MPTLSFEREVSISHAKGHEPDELRITVMFGILLVSLFAVSFPSVSKHVRALKIPHLVFFIGKHFGTGVILSTAFCHLLPDSFEHLQDREVNVSFPGVGRRTGLIILASLLTIFLIEYISTTYVDHLHSRPSAPPSPSITPSPSRPKTPTQNTNTNLIMVPNKHSSEPPSRAPTPCPAQNCSSYISTERTPLLAEPRPKRAKSLCNLDDDSMLSLILLNAPRLARGGLPHSGLSGWNREPACVCHMRVMHAQAHEIGEAFVEEEDVKDDQPGTIGRKRQIVGILILQLGIMIHSFVIGLTLAITSGTDFTSLVTAITFHQLFEGLSLGIRIAGVPQSTGPGRRWLAPVLYAFFAITTPLGMGVGLLLFASTQTGDSVQLHLAQGLMSGISAGMLIYASTVEMLAGDFVFGDVGGDHGHGHGHGHGHEHEHPHQHEHEKSPVRRKILAVLSLLAGATAMALVGLTED